MSHQYFSTSTISTSSGTGGAGVTYYSSVSTTIPVEMRRVINETVRNPLEGASVKSMCNYLRNMREHAGNGTELSAALQTITDTLEAMDAELEELRELVDDD